MGVKLVVADFDGTMTDAEEEGKPFLDGYYEDLSKRMGVSLEEVRGAARREEAEIAAAPDQHGWFFDGKIVAPAGVDPYLRSMAVARRLFDSNGLFPDENERSVELQRLYRENYPRSGIAFRPGARELLSGLRVPVAIVTNSDTTAVMKKLDALGIDGAARPIVYGNAKKYIVDDSWDAMPAALTVPGLSRPVWLRRRSYFTVLNAIRLECAARWQDVLVVGDIFELDHALPLEMGCRVVLVANEFTPPYERAFVGSHRRGHVVDTLEEARAIIVG